MRGHQIIWTSTALKQLDKIYIFIAKESPTSAYKIMAQIIRTVEKLKEFPDMGQEEEALKYLKKEHRYIVEKHYKTVYRVEGKVIHISTVFDTRQNPKKLKL